MILICYVYRNPMFVRSAIVQANGSSFIDDNYRTSTTAYLRHRQISIIKCIEQHFAQFQDQMINDGQHITIFFTYLYANCSMDDTEFINIKFNFSLHSYFCNILICDDIASYRDNSSFHANLPLGQKIGFNVWIRETIFV
ncbi:unnamed protein product [Rotaria sordida]|uniref:Uncharacterized protein n=2 Tax=Rotaria sordida TaxID=392033 RepID=A0A819BHB1_9BILA|nr:unnamed protein product [Rotaria sordida]